MSSWVSAKGPSTTTGLPLPYRTRQPSALGCSPQASSSTPDLASSSWKLVISAIRLGSSGKLPASDMAVARTMIM